MPSSYYDAVICILSIQNIHRAQSLKCKVNVHKHYFWMMTMMSDNLTWKNQRLCIILDGSLFVSKWYVRIKVLIVKFLEISSYNTAILVRYWQRTWTSHTDGHTTSVASHRAVCATVQHRAVKIYYVTTSNGQRKYAINFLLRKTVIKLV